MKPEIVHPRRRILPGRVLVAIVIAWSGWYASRVLAALERADRAASAQRGPACTSTVYYEPCPTGVWCYGEGGLSGWCLR